MRIQGKINQSLTGILTTTLIHNNNQKGLGINLCIRTNGFTSLSRTLEKKQLTSVENNVGSSKKTNSPILPKVQSGHKHNADPFIL